MLQDAGGPGAGEAVPGTPRQDDAPRCASPVALGRPPDVRSAPDPLTSGDPQIDAALGGGFYRGMVSELLGESSCGKTQLVMYTAVCTALGLGTPDCVLSGGAGRSVAIISTSGQSAVRRMVDRMVQMTRALAGGAADTAVSAMLHNVFLTSALTYEAAEHVLCYTLPGLLTHRDVALVVLDSVPPLFQEDSLPAPAPAPAAPAHTVRAARLLALGDWLKRLAAGRPGTSAQRRAVVVVNHVSDAFAPEKTLVRDALAQGHGTAAEHTLPLAYQPQAAHFSGLFACVTGAAPGTGDVRLESDLKTAQLGLVWANCLNARFLVSNTRRTAGGQVRRLRAVFTPMRPHRSEALYTISAGGIAAVQ